MIFWYKCTIIYCDEAGLLLHHCFSPSFIESIEESLNCISSSIPQFSQLIIEKISSKCILNLKAVNDTPRLYRRTNKQVSIFDTDHLQL